MQDTPKIQGNVSATAPPISANPPPTTQHQPVPVFEPPVFNDQKEAVPVKEAKAWLNNKKDAFTVCSEVCKFSRQAMSLLVVSAAVPAALGLLYTGISRSCPQRKKTGKSHILFHLTSCEGFQNVRSKRSECACVPGVLREISGGGSLPEHAHCQVPSEAKRGQSSSEEVPVNRKFDS